MFSQETIGNFVKNLKVMFFTKTKDYFIVENEKKIVVRKRIF